MIAFTDTKLLGFRKTIPTSIFPAVTLLYATCFNLLLRCLVWLVLWI